MIDTQYLIALIYILYYGLIGMTIIAVALLIVLAIIFSNSNNQ